MLEDVYEGAHCRCAFCHTHQLVPPATHPPRPSVPRPDQPGLRLEPLRGSGALALSTNVSIDIPRLPDAEPRKKLTWFHAGASAFAALVIVASMLTWNWSESINQGTTLDGSRLAAGSMSAVRAEVAQMLAQSDEDDFFGIPIGDAKTSIVIDNRDDMPDYTGDVARLAYSAVQFARSNNGAMSIVEARLARAGNNDKDPYYALPVLRIQSVRKRTDELNGVDSNLAAAIELASVSKPEQIVFVFAKPMDADEKEELEAAIRHTTVPVHIVALGDAASRSYASLADISGGKFIPVSDTALQQLVSRCAVQMPPPAK